MELLVILLGEFIFFPFLAMIGAVFNFLFSLICLLLDVLLTFIFSSKEKKVSPSKVGQIEAAVVKHKTTLFKPIAKAAGGIFVVFLVSILIVNTLFFAQTIRWVTGVVSEKTQTEIVFDDVRGNLLFGQVIFEGVHLKRNVPEKAGFDINAEYIDLDIDILSLLTKPIELEILHIRNVSGRAVAIKSEPKDIEHQEKQSSKTLKPKKEFIINDLLLEGVTVELQKAEELPLQMSLERFESAPFRSRYAVFDMFFRSNIIGNIEGHKILIASREEGNGRVTQWHLDHFPISIVNRYVHKAPLSWFKDGVVDIRVDDKWEYAEKADINMDWQLSFKGLLVEPPEDASFLSKSLSAPLIGYVKRKDGDMDLQFSLVMNESQFESASSLDASGLWDEVVSSMSEKIAQISGEKKEEIQQGIKNKVEGVKNFLKQKAK